MLQKTLATLALTFSLSLFEWNVLAECLTQEAKNTLWAEAKSSFNPLETTNGKPSLEQRFAQSVSVLHQDRDRSILYRNGILTPYRPGYISSNEWYYHTVHPHLSDTPADLHVGVGTTLNFNLLGARPGLISMREGVRHEKTRTALFVDTCFEVLTTLRSFFRPLWLVSETPAEWLGHLFSEPVDKSTSIGHLFDLMQDSVIDSNAAKSVAAFERMKEKLQGLVQSGKISTFDFRFSTSLVEFFLNQKLNRCRDEDYAQTFFPRAMRGDDLPKQLAHLYDSRKQPQDPETQKAIDRTSFLNNPENYHRVRQIYLDGQDYYAQANIMDENLWKRISDFTREKGLTLTDLYTSCIRECIHRPPPKALETMDFRQDSFYLYSTVCRSENSDVTRISCSAEPPDNPN